MADSQVTPVLVGCTASGKTGLLLRLRERRDFQVISADSRQVYRGMDIGTAKPSPDERAFLIHHLLDCIDPDQSFSAGDFERRALELIGSIRSSGSVPVVAGGTALYVMALTGALDPLPERCPGVRKGLGELELEVPGCLWRMLHSVDPATAESVGRGDIRRQTRAMELFALTGSPPSKLRKGGDPIARERFRIVGISVPGDEHRRRIGIRTDLMLDSGLVEEVGSLLRAGWGRESALGRTIGYAEVLDYLDGGIGTLAELREAIEINTWRLARRQRNMFGRIPGITWVREDPEEVESLLFAEGGG
ncbi:MAG: tRNA (adenosine(37)-N6)-dimethylallyltransferase MiaA [Candidatus Fermentibacteraceae bacterium]|nr:tRNA (adenosine(37)-N6)-dimethylallyltransferase MiaA [Candidatus Fermentibacteraceae bacterium]